MNIKTYLIPIVAMLVVLTTDSFAQTDTRVNLIRKLYEETNAKVADCEENGETSSVFMTELLVNKNNGSYPAVGIYRTAVKFYYTYGDRERNPYPDRLLMIAVETKRSNRVEISEFLFSETGQLVFYLEKKNGTERRVYFANEKAFKILDGDKALKLTDKRSLEIVKTIQNHRKALQSSFIVSLSL